MIKRNNFTYVLWGMGTSVGICTLLTLKPTKKKQSLKLNSTVLKSNKR